MGVLLKNFLNYWLIVQSEKLKNMFPIYFVDVQMLQTNNFTFWAIKGNYFFLKRNKKTTLIEIFH